MNDCHGNPIHAGDTVWVMLPSGRWLRGRVRSIEPSWAGRCTVADLPTPSGTAFFRDDCISLTRPLLADDYSEETRP